jgi:flavin-dependent dehydrogenase
MEFKIPNSNGKTVDLVQHIYEQKSIHQTDLSIHVGCDSTAKEGIWWYVLVVSFRYGKRGAHYIYQKIKIPAIRVEMGAWSKNNIALLGDARHAFAPIIGMGANMALEDAQVLAEEISRVNVDGIEHALKAYTKRRTNRVNHVRALSRFIEPWFNAHSRLLVAFRDAIIPLLPNVIMERMFISVLKEKV